jgi:ribosomal protein S18 acetylase RimI-like enzyme
VSVSGYRIRRATGADAEVIARHRVAMFRDMGCGGLPDERDAAPLEAAARQYLSEALPSGLYCGWLAEDGDGVIVAGGGMIVQRGVPRPENVHGGEEAYLLNVYVEPAHRRFGLARALMDAMLAWARERGLARVVLHASDDGRALYESLGFDPVTTEMRLVLPRR